MKNHSEVSGHGNVVIQGVTDSTISIAIDGHSHEIMRRLDALFELMSIHNRTGLWVSGKPIAVELLSPSTFEFILAQTQRKAELPVPLQEAVEANAKGWVQSLRQELLNQGVAVGNRSWAIFQHYGWLVEAFLNKMESPQGKEPTLRRLSFMAEAFQSTLRYLCYIQVAQHLQIGARLPAPAISAFIRMGDDAHLRFDYLNLLLVTTSSLSRDTAFAPEIMDFVKEVCDASSDLFAVALYLEVQRTRLLNGTVNDADGLDRLLDEYLTGLAYWLRKLSFLARYRLISIKDINLNYRLGTAKSFVHLYGELHGTYTEAHSEGEDYSAYAIEDVFTFNQSILLLKGSNAEASLGNISDTAYLSLSPLVIDQSVFSDRATQTPEVFYFIGFTADGRQYRFAQYKNELAYGNHTVPSNKELVVRAQNNAQPKLDELFKQLELVVKPFRTA